MKRALCRLAVAAALAAASVTAHAADPSQFSEAERRLFATDHLASLRVATRLEYAYRRSGSLQGEAQDRAVVTVAAPDAGGGHDVHVDFLSGARRLDLPDIKGAAGNPIILHFLEREVREMNRLTGGSANYYRKRIRMALAEAARVRTVTRTVDGRSVPAVEIFIAPYRDDPARSRYERFADKTFVLTLSEQVPGGVVELRSELLAQNAGGAPELMLAESLTFVGRR
ncbi:MAG TPA: hypothetical protein VNK91_10985 [Burkholderiaceae bacterium]|jgi:hypothetical protein|nr:hypothetical protein [Burkholderiaceae bacterium]